MGPTASGKTELALALHALMPVEVISVDASQVYRGMDIGTAKPDAATRRRVPHRLIDIRDPADTYSAADFRGDALREMQAITQRGRIPLLVGGTMFYFRVLEHGLPELPSADAAVRTGIAAEAQRLGWGALHARLARSDPRTAAAIDPADAQRIARALEIVALTGRPRPAIDGLAGAAAPGFPYRVARIAVAAGERSLLHERIGERFADMLQRGLVDEVRALMAPGHLSPSAPAMRTVGYRQVWQYLTGEIGYNDMVRRSIAATRQLAKRQLTWLRHRPGIVWITGCGDERVAAACEYVAGKLEALAA